MSKPRMFVFPFGKKRTGSIRESIYYQIYCAGCYKVTKETQSMHNLRWCQSCYRNVKEAQDWQELWRMNHPGEAPGSAALAWMSYYFSLDK